MRPFTMIGAVAMNEKRILIAAGALSAALAACSSEITPSDGMGATAGTAAIPPSGSGGATAVPGSGGSTAKGGAGPVGSSGSPSTTTTGGSSSNGGNGSATTCAPGIPATTQIPRLLNRQY